MLKIPSLATSKTFADKYEEEAFWQLHKKNVGGWINRSAVKELAAELRSLPAVPKISLPRLNVPSVIVPSIALPFPRVQIP